METRETLEQLGYHFNDDGELRKIDDNSRFVFTNQEDYVRIGDAMTRELYRLLENRCGLKRVGIPRWRYVELIEMYNLQEKAIFLAMFRLILNESLEVGSQIPYIERALKNDWGVIVCSTNTDEELVGYPSQHLHAVYERMLKSSPIQRIFVVAHSRGGPDFANAYMQLEQENRFEVVCLTDSVHFEMPRTGKDQASKTVFINWSANEKLKQPKALDDDSDVFSEVHEIYAGTTEHERSSYSAYESVFHVLENWRGASDAHKLIVEAAALTSGKALET
ncbi:unnamed protein product [Nippostrongylus brasiliensis]|uniref:UPF0528 protein (inferred by orthology to a C. elegans protein) n=1 Tax=Nippostrongylus brasiliensis TaxID=27835 RepID=A0A0N4Y2X7_NIPBR|nr:unnamed protein product [Nippostrongylus brasiliensis]